MSEGIVRNIEDEADALRKAGSELGRISFSSAYNSHLDSRVKHIMDFNEFNYVFSKILDWSREFDKVIEQNKQE